MSDPLDPLTDAQPDNGLRPPASLTSIPVRRRRKSGEAPPRPSSAVQPSKHDPADAPAKPRKEAFGKLRQAPVPPDPATDTPQDIEPVADEFAAHRSAALPPEDIIALWESLAGETSLPALFDLDMARVAAHWPNSLLLRASGSPRRPVVEVARIFSADAAHDAAPLPIDTMTIDWMMALAREVMHDGVPVHELDNVSADDPGVEYGVIALPFGAAPGAVDHVLCHLYRYDGPSPEDAAARDTKARGVGAKAGRRMVASIFGRRQSAAG